MPFVSALSDNPSLQHYRGGHLPPPGPPCYDNRAYQAGLDYEMKLWNSISKEGGLSRVCFRDACRKRFDVIPPHMSMPVDGRRFEATTVNPPPPANSGGVYLNYQVQSGYRGIIQSIVNFYSPTSGTYGPGPGDLTWGLEIGGVTAKGYGNILVPLGSLQDRFSLEGAGFLLQPGDNIKYWVSLAAGSPIAGGFITCSVAGYLWPI